MNYVIASTVGLYSYNTATKEFTLLNETRYGYREFNVRFTNNTIFYINYNSTSNSACAGMDIYVTESRNDPQPQPIPYITQTQSTGDSKTLSAGAIGGIVVAAVFLIAVILLLF